MSVLWLTARATGEVALLFLTIVLALGALSAVRVGGRRVPRFVIAGMHRNLTLAGLGFLTVHILATVLDSYVPIDVVDSVVPFASAYRPIWLGLGAFAFDTLLVLTVTSLLRTRLNPRWWRAAHWSAYGCWLLAVVHALGTGSDTRTSVFLLLTGGCAAVALGTLAWRLAAGGPGHEMLRVGAGLGAVIAIAAIGGWAMWGPLAGGWALRAGTPPSLVAGANIADTAGSPPTPSSRRSRAAASTVLHAPFTAPFTGRAHARFTGPAGEAGRLTLSGRTIWLGTTGDQRLYVGRSHTDRYGRLIGVLHDAAGNAVTVRVTLPPNTSGGVLRVLPGARTTSAATTAGGD
ncbi:MAG TPA: hypothetical protein VH912_14205 [Streptosporangiaceae bacterium]|jgi:hypothetical protein